MFSTLYSDPVTVANLPGSPLLGMRAIVTDATVTTIGTTVAGSGTNKVAVYWNGSNWIIGDWATATLSASPVGANPTATAGPNANNGSATTFMRSDASPAIQLGTSGQAGLLQGDGATLSIAAGVVSLNLAHANTWSATQTFGTAAVTTLDLGNNTVLTGPSAGQFEIAIGGTNELDFGVTTATTWTFGANLALADAKNIPVGSTTGTIIATATTQKLGFYNKAPVAQQTNGTTPTTATITTNATTTTPWGFATSTQANNISKQVSSNSAAIAAVITALHNLGLCT